ncbi:MAG: helicase-exonuclease AddAB subunit AddA [Clostridia bacterium]|nr:helicase-exonuclease AddAB subunit AddA [Clostridia bacterium]
MATFSWTPAQSDAIHTQGKSIAVSAAAGSGKTAVLTRRIIEKVCAPDCSGDISRLLVVTFTKAAAAELVSRISDALSQELASHPENAHIRSQSLLVSSAKISTIHSFCLDLIRTNFQKLNIPPDFSAGSETEIDLMMNTVAEELISDYFEGELREGEEPIENFSLFADMFGDVAHTDALAKTLLSLYHSLSSTVDFLDRIEYFRENAKSAAENGFDGSPWEMCIREYLIGFLKHYGNIYKDIIDYAKGEPKLSKPLGIIAAEWDVIEKVRSFAEAGTSYYEMPKYLAEFHFEKLVNSSRDEKLKSFTPLRTKFKDDLEEFTKKLYIYSEDALSYCLTQTAEAMEMLGAFMRTFEKRFSEEKRRRKLITFADMERFALELLYDKENDAPTELALSLRDSYDEIYIDEYQDTNELQDKIFSLISKEDNRFNVGDIKQSIYAFRGAKPMIFSELLDSRPKYEKSCGDKAVKIFLSENFRSSSEILEFCNGIFEKLMNAKEIRYGEDERLHPGGGKHAALPEMYLIAKSKNGDKLSDEAEFVAEKIEALLRSGTKLDGSRIKPSDIAILLRSTSSSAVFFEQALSKRRIPCKNDADKEFFESPEVLLMLSLLSAIDNPTRDIYLASALKSPLYGVTLDELLFIRRYHREGSLFDALRKFTAEKNFAKGKKFLDDYEKYVLIASETPCDDLIWQIYTDTGIFSILSADETRSLYEIEQANANLIAFYHYARGFERGGFKGLSGFITFINEVLANKAKLDVSGFAAPGDVVHIMTIHKSKGLEFPVCFVSNLNKQFNRMDRNKKTIYHENLGISIQIPAKDGMVRLETPLRQASVLEIDRQCVEEELRLLYVALTRPKERLYLTASVSDKDIEKERFSLSKTYGEYALKNQFFSEYKLRSSNDPLDLLLTAMAGKTMTFTMEIVDSHTDEESDGAETQEESLQTESAEEEETGMTYYQAKKIVSERLDYAYPYRRLSEIPSKLSVSKLYPAILDGDDGQELAREVPRAVKMPNFLMKEQDEELTAAEKGTAMHLFMQFCDFDLVSEYGVNAEIQRLAEKRFIFDADKAKMDVEKLNSFFKSEIAKEIFRSERVYREKRFMVKLPASYFTEEDKESLADEKLLVQGILDCVFFNEKGELILLDYKTDFFKEGTPRSYVEKTLRERHARQLGYYKLACEQLFGMAPAHTYVYSFAIGDTVEIF